MTHSFSKLFRRQRRKWRVRKKISGIASRPRLSVFRSLQHIYVQAVDDVHGKTVASASTVDKDLRVQMSNKTGNTQAASLIGETIAKRLKQKGISKAVFDRNGNLYHGRVKALAEAARKEGLQL